jgi:putative membrane protein
MKIISESSSAANSGNPADKRKKVLALALLFIVLVISCIHPVYPDEMFLQHSVTLLVIILLFQATRSNWMSNFSFYLLVFFLLLHIIGARWIYSFVPYNQWIQAVSGWNFNDFFGFKRNHYDRLIHFLFGLLLLIPASEFFRKKTGIKPDLSWLAGWSSLQVASMVYEVFEWGLTLVLSPDTADSYNGQQGDLWDAQKDMALALLGASILLLSLYVFPQFRKKLEKI